MKNIKVELLHATPLWIAARAIRRSKGTEDKSDTEPLKNSTKFNSNGKQSTIIEIPEIGPKDRDLVHRVGCKFKHESVLELVWFSLDIDGISRSCLQEWSRTRIGFSQTVRSSRYTLQELKETDSFNVGSSEKYDDRLYRASKFIVITGDSDVDHMSLLALENLRLLISSGISNDVSKYALPESFRTSLTCSFNLRSLRHMLSLRTAKSALPEYRHLAHLIYAAIPSEYHYLLEDCIIEPDPLGDSQ